MPHLNHTGPEGEGPRTGRGLGRCKKKPEKTDPDNNYQLGKGMGLKRRAGGGEGKGRRIQSGIKNDKKSEL